METISIVLPTYNGSKFIEKAINSIFDQSYQDFELIISDDNSTDETQSIIRNIQDSRVKFFVNEGEKGIFHNLNAAIYKSTGKYIQIFCQDDVMEKNLIEEQISLINKYPEAGMVFCDKADINDSDKVIRPNYSHFSRNYLPEVISSSVGSLFFLAFGCLPGNISPVMITRSAWDSVGTFNPSLSYVSDFDYWCRLSKKFDIVFNPAKLMNCRNHKLRASNVLHYDLRVIKEEIPIWQGLINSIDNCEKENIKKIEKYLVYDRGVQYFHWIVRAALFRDPKVAVKGILNLSHPFQINRLILAYIFSINGKLRHPNIEKTFGLLAISH